MKKYKKNTILLFAAFFFLMSSGFGYYKTFCNKNCSTQTSFFQKIEKCCNEKKRRKQNIENCCDYTLNRDNCCEIQYCFLSFDFDIEEFSSLKYKFPLLFNGFLDVDYFENQFVCMLEGQSYLRPPPPPFILKSKDIILKKNSFLI